MSNRAYVPILKLSRTTYFDSLTGITESESGKSSEALKITGKPELHKKEKFERIGKKRVNYKRYYKVCLLFTEGGKTNNDLEAISVSKQ